MVDEPTCTPVNLGGGATLETPCTGFFNACTVQDYFRARRVLQYERNKLIGLVNRYIALVRLGKLTWNAQIDAAHALTTAGWDTLAKFPESEWYVNAPTPLGGGGLEALEAIQIFTQQAAASHQAACEVAALMKAAGEPVPAPPVPVPPEKGITDAIAQGAADLAKAAASGAEAVFYVVAGAALLGGGWLLYQSMKSSSQVVVVPLAPSTATSPTSTIPPAPTRATSKGSTRGTNLNPGT